MFYSESSFLGLTLNDASGVGVREESAAASEAKDSTEKENRALMEEVEEEEENNAEMDVRLLSLSLNLLWLNL